MTAPALTRPIQPVHIDSRDLELLLTVDVDGRVEIQYQAGDDHRAQRALSGLAAQVTARQQATTPPRPGRPVDAPPTGQAAIACGCCGQVVNLLALRWRNRRALLLGCVFCTPEEDR